MFSLRSQRTISFLAFVIISIIMITLVVRSAREDHDMKKEQAGYVAEIKMNELKNCFENCISSTEIMGTFLESEESVSYSHFETLSNHIYHHYDYVTALILVSQMMLIRISTICPRRQIFSQIPDSPRMPSTRRNIALLRLPDRSGITMMRMSTSSYSPSIVISTMQDHSGASSLCPLTWIRFCPISRSSNSSIRIMPSL